MIRHRLALLSFLLACALTGCMPAEAAENPATENAAAENATAENAADMTAEAFAAKSTKMSDASETEADASGADRGLSEKLKESEELKGSKEPEETEETEAEVKDESIVDSIRQEMNGYNWQDLYVILTEVERTSPYLEGNVPEFALVRVGEDDDPILIVGNHPEGSSAGSWQMFITDDTRVHELLSFEGTPMWDDDAEAFCVPEEGMNYRYAPHVLLSSETDASDELSAIEMTDLVDFYLTSETIEDCVQEMIGGGG